MNSVKKFTAIIIAAAMLLTCISVTAFGSEKEFLLGDVDRDGQVSPYDARIILRAAANLDELSDEETALGDTYSDGKITAADARKILAISGKLTDLPQQSEDFREDDTTPPGTYPNRPVIEFSAEASDYDEIHVTVTASDFAHTQAGTLFFKYDSEYLYFKDIKTSDTNNLIFMGGPVVNSKDMLSLSFAYASEALSDTAELCTITFKVLKEGYSYIYFDVGSWFGTQTPLHTQLDDNTEITLPELRLNAQIQNDTLTVLLSGKNIKGVTNADIFFYYDPEYLELTAINEAPEADFDIAISNDAQDGFASFSFAYESFALNDTDICSLTFNILKEGETSLRFTVESWEGVDAKPGDGFFNIKLTGYDNSCGDNLTWYFDGEETLYIEGSGKMYDFDVNPAPWDSLGDKITKVEIADGVTTIGKHAFACCEKLDVITIPESVTEIGLWGVGFTKDGTKSDILFIRCRENSAAYNYAQANSFSIDTEFSDINTVIMGDLDGNGKVTAADARLALRYSAKLETPNELQKRAADTDGNSKITAADARTILRVAAKLENF